MRREGVNLCANSVNRTRVFAHTNIHRSLNLRKISIRVYENVLRFDNINSDGVHVIQYIRRNVLCAENLHTLTHMGI